MKWSRLSHIGLVRKSNEDNSCICDDIQLLAVADGMGGHKAGETASKLALEAMASYLRNNRQFLKDNPPEALRKAFDHANTTVYGYSRDEGEEFHGMGTTLTAVLPRGDKIFVAHVGDSRAYLVRGNMIKLLTSDHSLVNELVKNGGLTRQEAEKHPHRNILTRAVGTSPTVGVDVDVEPVKKGDIVILCTDGLSNLVDLDEMKKVATDGESLGEKAQQMIERALARGGDDNITVILYQVE